MILIFENLKFRPRTLCTQQEKQQQKIFLMLTANIHNEIIISINLCPPKTQMQTLYEGNYKGKQTDTQIMGNFNKTLWSKQIK